MNEQLLMIYLEKVQVKSFSKPKWVAKMLDKYVLALIIVSPLLLLIRIAGEELTRWLMNN